MEKKVEVNLNYIKPEKSFIYPLYSYSGKIILPARTVLTENKIKKIRRIYGDYVYYFESSETDGTEEKGKISGKYFQMAKDQSKCVIEEILKTDKLSVSSFRKAERVIEDIISNLILTEIDALTLLKDMKSFDDYVYQHLVNVGILTALFSQKMGTFSAEEVKNITLGAYLIDIGLMKIDKQLLKKEGSYTASEIKQMKRHPQLGYELLKNITGIHPIVLQTVLLHHERYNNRGYYNLPYEDLPIAPKIASICDIYDACTTKRPFREALPMSQTIQVILNTTNTSFDNKLINDFINFLWPLLQQKQAPYKEGDYCILNGKEIASVTDYDPQNILKPKLDVLCKYDIARKKVRLSFYKRPIKVDLKLDPRRYLTKIITDKSHLHYLKLKIAQHQINRND